MRIAALIFGLLAGLLGVGVIIYGNFESGLAASPVLADYGASNARVIVYLVPLLGVIGGLLALFRPRTGAVLLLLSAAGWLIEAFLVGHGALLFAAIPFTFAGAAALVGLSSRAQPQREDEQRRAVRSYEPDWEEAEDYEEPSAYPPRRGRPQERGARRSALARRAPPRQQGDDRRRPRAADYPPEDDFEDEGPDYVDAEETVSGYREEPLAYDDEEESYEDYADEPLEAYDDGASEDPYDDEEEPYGEQARYQPQERIEPSAPESRRPPSRAPSSRWSLPDPEQSAAPQRVQQRSLPKREPPRMVRSAPLPPPSQRRLPGRRAPAPPEPDFEVPPEQLRPSPQNFRPRNVYRDFEPTPVDPPRSSVGRGFVRIAVLVAFFGVIAAFAAFVYTDYAKGPNSLLFGSHQQQDQQQAAAPSAAPTARQAVPLAPAPTVTDAAAQVTAPQAAPQAAAPGAPTTALASAAQAAASGQPGQTYSNPFNYCRAIDTADSPDNRYTGPPLPPAVRASVGPGVAPANIRWRCDSQQLLACNTKGGAACELTPTVDYMLAYCAAHQNAQNIPAPNGAWSCNGKRPVIPRDQKWPVDARGFYPGAWALVPPPGAAL